MNIPGELAAMLLESFMDGKLTEADLKNETKFYCYTYEMYEASDADDFKVDVFCENLKLLVETCQKSPKLRDRITRIADELLLAAENIANPD